MLMRPSATTALLVPAVALGAILLARAFGSKTPADPNKPVPNPQAPTNVDVLKQQLDDLLAQANANPLSVDPDAMEQLAVQLDEAGLHAEAARLRLAEITARGAQGPHGGGTFTPAPGMPAPPPPPPAVPAPAHPAMTAADQATFARYTDPTIPPPRAYVIDLFATKLMKLGFTAQAHTLRLRAMDVRAMGGGGSLPADTHKRAGRVPARRP